MSMHYEVEQKYRLADPQAVVALLTQVDQLGGIWSSIENHADTYYAHPARNFAETDEALRIRSIVVESVSEQHFVTYKGPKISAETKTRRELELPLTPPEFGPEQLDELWVALGFSRVATVRKTRRKTELPSGAWTFTVDLDELPNVGTFVELETLASEKQVASAESALLKLAQTLGLTDVVRRSYLGMLLESRGV